MRWFNPKQKGDKGVLTDPHLTVLELLQECGEVYFQTSQAVYRLSHDLGSKAREETYSLHEVEMMDAPLLGDCLHRGKQWASVVKHIQEILANEERR